MHRYLISEIKWCHRLEQKSALDLNKNNLLLRGIYCLCFRILPLNLIDHYILPILEHQAVGKSVHRKYNLRINFLNKKIHVKLNQFYELILLCVCVMERDYQQIKQISIMTLSLGYFRFMKITAIRFYKDRFRLERKKNLIKDQYKRLLYCNKSPTKPT